MASPVKHTGEIEQLYKITYIVMKGHHAGYIPQVFKITWYTGVTLLASCTVYTGVQTSMRNISNPSFFPTPLNAGSTAIIQLYSLNGNKRRDIHTIDRCRTTPIDTKS